MSRDTLVAQLTETVDKLKGALGGAREKILEQQDVLIELTAQPRPQAVVVAVREEVFRAGKPEEYTLGTRVRVNAVRNSNRKVVGLAGTIIDDASEDDKYDVTVRVDGEDGALNFGVGRPTKPRELDILQAPAAVIVNYQNQRLELSLRNGLAIRVGDTVALSAKTMQVVDVVPDPGIGETVMVRQTVDTGHSEVDWQGSSRVVVHADALGSVAKGDRVVLDPSAAVIVRNLGRGEERFLFETQTNVAWEHIGGLDDAKLELREAIEFPYTQPELYRYYDEPIAKGVLLMGPPRCGKTMLGKALATALWRMHGQQARSRGFFYVKGSEILDKYVGVAEGLVRHLFNRGRQHKKDHGYPAVIFIDEADAIMYKRGTGISSDIERTIVPAFLAEMDGLEESGAIVILATNRADVLDPAIVGDGRIDRRILVPRPDPVTARHIAKMRLASAPLANQLKASDAVETLINEMYQQPRVIRELVLKNGSVTTTPFMLKDIINGAMIVAGINEAKKLARRRDQAARSRTGICRQDMVGAVDSLVRQNMHLNHDDAIRDLVERLPVGTRLLDVRMPASPAAH